jgi:hypothetical protein
MPSDTGQRGDEWDIFNYGGLRRPGIIAGPRGGGFKSFATPAEGVRAAASLAQTYQDRHGINTLRGIINRWAPADDNGGQGKVDAMVDAASRITGFGPDQPLNLHDSATLAKVTEALERNPVRFERNRSFRRSWRIGLA